jgi:iron(III) transport system ATP-binding protein
MTTDDDILLELHQVDCQYGGLRVVSELSFRVRRGGIACLLGPSGCGKTTVLRAIAGLEPVTAGEIQLRGQVVSTTHATAPPEQRGIGMVFQDYALFPHLTVHDNVGFGLRRWAASERRRRVDELLALVDLGSLGDRYPHELSGGQQQRVSLARALAPRPDLVLLDEPFSSLDVELRERLGLEMHDIFKSRGITALLVTHDQHEAFAMADQIGIMQAGRIVQWDTPYNLYHEPVDRFVADFIGQGRLIRGTLLDHDSLDTEVGIIRGNRAYGWPAGSKVDLLLRPDDVQPDPHGPLRGRVVKKAFKGPQILYTLAVGSGTQILALFPSHMDHEIGADVGIRIDAQHLVAFRSQE